MRCSRRLWRCILLRRRPVPWLHARAKPVIAAVIGIAADGGFELALTADLAV